MLVYVDNIDFISPFTCMYLLNSNLNYCNVSLFAAFLNSSIYFEMLSFILKMLESNHFTSFSLRQTPKSTFEL